MNWNTLPVWAKIAIMVGVAGAVVYIGYTQFPNLTDQQNKIKALGDAISQLDRDIKAGQAAKRNVEELNREISAQEEKLGQLLTILPKEEKVPELLDQIQSLSLRSDVDILNVNPGSKGSYELYKTMPYSFRVEGQYHNLAVFFDRLTRLSRIVNVYNVRINSMRKPGKTISASFDAVTYLYAGDEE